MSKVWKGWPLHLIVWPTVDMAKKTKEDERKEDERFWIVMWKVGCGEGIYRGKRGKKKKDGEKWATKQKPPRSWYCTLFLPAPSSKSNGLARSVSALLCNPASGFLLPRRPTTRHE